MAEREASQRDLTGIGEINALLGPGTRYEGTLAFEGRVRIDGQFRGQVFSEGVLILGEGAEVDADIEVGTLIVRGGQLRGRVRARRLIEIYPPGRVYGDLRAPQVFVDKGVHFEGSCSMDEALRPDGRESLPPEGRVSLIPPKPPAAERVNGHTLERSEGRVGSGGDGVLDTSPVRE